MVDELPPDLEESARHYGVHQRDRKIDSAASLLRLVLMYALLGSLRLTAIWALALGVCDISRQALQRRFIVCAPWLRHILQQLLDTHMLPAAPLISDINNVHLEDGSSLARPGSPGTEWRLHLSWAPFRQGTLGLDVTDAHGAEGLERLVLAARDLVIADRGYGLWRNLRVVLEAGAYAILRLNWSNFPLLTPEGARLDIAAWLAQTPDTVRVSERFVVAADDPEARPLRLIAARLPPDKAEEARTRAEKSARKDKRTPHPNTLMCAQFCILLTNLPLSWSAQQVAAWYRIRWQVEWCFRRWKSLCHLDELPSYPSPMAEVVLYAKLILIILLQRFLASLPWQEWWAAEEPAPVPSTCVQLVYEQVANIVCPKHVLSTILENLPLFMRHLRSSRRKRKAQLAEFTSSSSRIVSKIAMVCHPP